VNAIHAMLVMLADPEQGGRDGPEGRDAHATPLNAAQLERLLDLAERHGVLLTVSANLSVLRAAGRPVINDDPAAKALLERLPDRLVRRSGVCLALRQQAREIVQAFEHNDLPAVLLKGQDFADRLYPQPWLRSFTDVDLLIPQTALAASRRVMIGLGYELLVPAMKYDVGYGEEVWRREQRCAGDVEIHTDLVNSPTLRRGVSVRFEDLRLEQSGGRAHPSPAATLLIAAVHGAASHGFDRLQLLVDLVQAVRRLAGTSEDAWLQEALARTGAARALALGLSLAGRLFGERACDEVASRLRLSAAWPDRLAVSCGAVLRAHHWRDSLGRQIFRQRLKRRTKT
jgi:hypothetical protein